MRSLSVPAAGVVAGALVLGALVAAAGAQDKDAKVDVAAVYKLRCAMCHGANGDSKLPGMSFADGEWKHGSAMKDVMNTIRNGAPGTAMLPFKSKLKDPEIEALARYVRAFDPKLKAEAK